MICMNGITQVSNYSDYYNQYQYQAFQNLYPHNQTQVPEYNPNANANYQPPTIENSWYPQIVNNQIQNHLNLNLNQNQNLNLNLNQNHLIQNMNQNVGYTPPQAAAPQTYNNVYNMDMNMNMNMNTNMSMNTNLNLNMHTNTNINTNENLNINLDDISISPSDHIIYCFNRKFSNYTVECSQMLNKLWKTFPFKTHGLKSQWQLHEYRFVRRRANQYYLQIEPDDICPAGDECRWRLCQRLHYISKDDICSYSRATHNKKCHKIHLHKQRFVDRICSVMYSEIQSRPATIEPENAQKLKFDEYRIPLKNFLKSYEQKYGAINYSHHNGDKYKEAYGYQYGECIRLLKEYGQYYTLDCNETNLKNIISGKCNGNANANRMRRYRLWDVEFAESDVKKKTPFIKFNSNGMFKKICYQHMMDNSCAHSPRYFCPWLHPDQSLVRLIESCPNHKHNVKSGNKCNVFHISSKFTQPPIYNFQYKPLSRSVQWIRDFFQRQYATIQNQNKKHLPTKFIPQTRNIAMNDQVQQDAYVNNVLVDDNGVLSYNQPLQQVQVRRDFLHFADQLFDCFERQFNTWINASTLLSKMKIRYPGRDVFLSKYRFLQSREVTENGRHSLQYLFAAQTEDLCPMGEQCSWFGCCRLHHISYEEMCDAVTCDDAFCNKLHVTSQRFVDRIVSILMSECNNRNDMRDMTLSRCKFWLSDIHQAYLSLYGEDLLLNKKVTSEQRSHFSGKFKDLAAYLSEYAKFYILNKRSGHTEYNLLWRVYFDKIRGEPFVKWNTESREKICARHMKGGCSYEPCFFCPWIHVDLNLVSMIHSCECRNANRNGLNNFDLKCGKYHLKSYHLIEPKEQEFQPLNRSLEQVRAYIATVKLMKHRNYKLNTYNFQNPPEVYDNANVRSGGPMIVLDKPDNTQTKLVEGEYFVQDTMTLDECLAQENWSLTLRQLEKAKQSRFGSNVSDLHRAHKYIRVEWSDHAHISYLNNHSHLYLINELFHLGLGTVNKTKKSGIPQPNRQVQIIDVCINGTRANVSLKYEICEREMEESTIHSLTQLLNRKCYAKEWCYNRAIKMKMICLSLSNNKNKDENTNEIGNDDGCFVLFEFQGMNPLVSVEMTRKWFEQRLRVWRFENLRCLKYRDGALQYLVKPNKFSVTNHAEIFLYDQSKISLLLNMEHPAIFNNQLPVRMVVAEAANFKPWIHSDRHFFSDNQQLDTLQLMQDRHQSQVHAKNSPLKNNPKAIGIATRVADLEAPSSPAVSVNTHYTHDLNTSTATPITITHPRPVIIPSTETDNLMAAASGSVSVTGVSIATSALVPPIPATSVYSLKSVNTHHTRNTITSFRSTLVTEEGIHPYLADRIVDCCDRKFHQQIAFDEITSQMINRYDKKEIAWHKYRFVQTSNSQCIINLQADDICANGDRCLLFECRKLHHISSAEICDKHEQCEIFYNEDDDNEEDKQLNLNHNYVSEIDDETNNDFGSKCIPKYKICELKSMCPLLHFHSLRLTDRIASVLLYEKVNHPVLHGKPFKTCWIYLHRFLQLYQELYSQNFEHLVYDMNVEKEKESQSIKKFNQFANIIEFITQYGQFLIVDFECGNRSTYSDTKSKRSKSKSSKNKPRKNYKQLWQFKMRRPDTKPQITFQQNITELVCADHMTKQGCHYEPLFMCPYLHLDKNLVSTEECECRHHQEIQCQKYHLRMSNLKKPVAQQYRPMDRSVHRVRESIIRMRTVEIEVLDERDTSNQLSWSNHISKLDSDQVQGSLHSPFKYLKVEWQSHPLLTTDIHSYLQMIDQLFKLTDIYDTPIVDISVIGTRKNIGLLYNVVSQDLWLELKAVLISHRESIWCYNRIIKFRLAEKMNHDGTKHSYIVIELQGVNPLISVEMMQCWLENLIRNSWKFAKFDQAIQFNVGFAQYLRAPHYLKAKRAELYLFNPKHVDEIIDMHRQRGMKLFSNSLNIRFLSTKNENPQWKPWVHSDRGFYDHKPAEMFEALIYKSKIESETNDQKMDGVMDEDDRMSVINNFPALPINDNKPPPPMHKNKLFLKKREAPPPPRRMPPVPPMYYDMNYPMLDYQNKNQNEYQPPSVVGYVPPDPHNSSRSRSRSHSHSHSHSKSKTVRSKQVANNNADYLNLYENNNSNNNNRNSYQLLPDLTRQQPLQNKLDLNLNYDPLFDLDENIDFLQMQQEDDDTLALFDFNNEVYGPLTKSNSQSQSLHEKLLDQTASPMSATLEDIMKDLSFGDLVHSPKISKPEESKNKCLFCFGNVGGDEHWRYCLMMPVWAKKIARGESLTAKEQQQRHVFRKQLFQ